MKAHPYRVWILVAVIAAAAIGLFLYRNLDANLLLVFLVAVNCVTVLLFGYDKMASQREGAGRVPNAVLFGLAVIGGALGAAVGMRVFHHKTGQRYRWWRLVVWASLLAYIVLLVLWLF
jgi:uncharacterized membrane protein YsdA (DUF1294 family)